MDEVSSEHPKARLAKQRGASLLDLAESEAAEGEEVVQFSMLADQEFSQGLSSALEVVNLIEQTGGNTIQEIKQQEAAYAELRERFAEKYQDIMDLGVSLFYNVYIESRLWGTYAAYAIKAPEQQKERWERNITRKSSSAPRNWAAENASFTGNWSFPISF